MLAGDPDQANRYVLVVDKIQTRRPPATLSLIGPKQFQGYFQCERSALEAAKTLLPSVCSVQEQSCLGYHKYVLIRADD